MTMFVQLLAALCLRLAVPAASAPNTDPLAPVIGKKFKLDHCNDMKGLFHSLGMSDTSILLVKNLTIESELVKFGDEFKEVKGVCFTVNGVQRKFVVEIPFRLGEEMEKETKLGRRIRYTVTREGNTFTKVWTKGPSGGTTITSRGTTVTSYAPEELKSTIKTGGATYNCVYRPVCTQGDLNCDNEV